MKKSFSIFGMLMLISSVVLAGGIDNPLVPSNMAIVKTNTGARVFYTTGAEKINQVHVKIYNTKGNEVFSDVIKSKESFSRVYNLTNLPQGEYRVVMEDENGIREELFSTREELLGEKKRVEVLSTTIYSKKLQKCLVAFYSEGDAEVSVKLFDKNGNVVSADALSVDGQAARLFSLEKLNGPVTVEVSDANGVLRSSVIGN